MRLALILAVTLCCAAFGQQTPPGDHTRVELKGTVEKVSLERGKGMPSVEVRHDGKTIKVVLGSMRYLMEQNFNPKAGQKIEVTGVQAAQNVYAYTVKLGPDGSVLRLRDEDGRPVWRGGRMGRPRR